MVINNEYEVRYSINGVSKSKVVVAKSEDIAVTIGLGKVIIDNPEAKIKFEGSDKLRDRV